jgi:ATP-dependent DNA ligase
LRSIPRAVRLVDGYNPPNSFSIARASPTESCGWLAAEGAILFAKASELGLEGIVSKREGSFYKSGKSRNWLKTINPDFVRA